MNVSWSWTCTPMCWQGSGIADPYLFCDHVTRVQSWPPAAESGSSSPQLNDRVTLPPGGVEMQACEFLLQAPCLISEFRCLMGFNVCNNDTIFYMITFSHLEGFPRACFPNMPSDHQVCCLTWYANCCLMGWNALLNT